MPLPLGIAFAQAIYYTRLRPLDTIFESIEEKKTRTEKEILVRGICP